jgi:hypothetical protein
VQVVKRQARQYCCSSHHGLPRLLLLFAYGCTTPLLPAYRAVLAMRRRGLLQLMLLFAEDV